MRHHPSLRPAALLLLALLPSVPVVASESTSLQLSPSVTKGQLEQLHTRNILLQAQVQGAQLERQLEENQTGSASSVIPASPGAGGYATLPGAAARPVVANTRPIVLEINGRDRQLKATLQLTSGQTLIVSPGSRLPGTEQTVKSISLTGVMLSDGTLLTFGG
ncbi:type IV pilus biogenesis protein PilP [Enterobacter sp. SECR19-1250]|uniref:type IV pilus biogenesis protein PilP n=1 Tax=Enterobacter sp. SECR19-1250 TaxID=2749084 RepID=UPI0015B71D78|nr:type IV pilus biogenesis protein PilP [Enterobacter sp. SECR19-1250]NWJ78858.1 type IV pilus biogenesis protein PilP [Enterobacter sp. SECR19-1250]